MRRLIVVAIAVIAAVATLTATTAGTPGPAPKNAPPQSVTPPAPSQAQPGGCQKQYRQKVHAHYARRIFNHKPVVTHRARKRLRKMRGCMYSQKAHANARALEHRLKVRRRARFSAYSVSSSLTPYHCGSHGDFAIPCYIVGKESGFRPDAKNPSSTAYGYYQLLDTWWGYLGRYPTIAEQHRIAARLWDGGAGSGNWALTR